MATGYRGLLAPWIGGAGKPPASATQGYRGLFAFWMGGAATYGSTPPPDPGIVDWIIRARRHCIR